MGTESREKTRTKPRENQKRRGRERASVNVEKDGIVKFVKMKGTTTVEKRRGRDPTTRRRSWREGCRFGKAEHDEEKEIGSTRGRRENKRRKQIYRPW